MRKNVIVSIIIPVYNAESLLKRCFDSVINQDGKFEVELIIVDDGSTDNSKEIARSNSCDPIVIEQKNQGPATARNKGIEKASGQYLAFLDADDYWLPNFISKTIDFLENNSDAIAVSVGQTHKIPGKPDKTMPEILEKESGKYSAPVLLDDFFAFWAEHNHVCTGSVMMRTDVVKQTGGQRPELRITEDLEFWAYLATFGKWGFIPEVLFVSDGGAVTKQTGWLEKNKIRWASAPTLEEWEIRIASRIIPSMLDGYYRVRGRIAHSLVYSMILSNRDTLARRLIINNKGYLPKNKFKFVWLVFSYSTFMWRLLSDSLRLREKYRTI